MYELLSKLSSTLRVISLTGHNSYSYRHTLPVKIPRMEALTQFSMFKPWEFEEQTPPISFDEIFPKLETLTFATQTEGSFSYLMSGMRSPTVTSFSVWLTSTCSGHGAPIGVGYPFVDPNRVIGPNPMVMVQRIDLDLLPPRDPARLRVLRPRRNFEQRERRVHVQPHVLHAVENPIEGGIRANDLRQAGGAGAHLHINPIVVLAENRNQEDVQYHQQRLRRARLRADVHRRANLELQLQQLQHYRRRELADAMEREQEPRCLHLRRRLQELRDRLEEQRRRVNNLGNEDMPMPRPRADILRHGYLPVEPGLIPIAPFAPRARFPPREEEVVNLSSDSDEDMEERNILPEIRAVPVLPVQPQPERRLQDLAAAVIRPENLDHLQELRVNNNNANGNDNNNVANEVRAIIEQGIENPNQDAQEPMQVVENQERAGYDPWRVPPLPAEANGGLVIIEENIQVDDVNDVERENNNNENVGDGGANANNNRNAQVQRDAPADEWRVDLERRVGADGQQPRQEDLPRRRMRLELEQRYRRFRGQIRQQLQQRQNQLLPGRPVTMTKVKMQQINVAFINLTKLKINICGPETCGLKYIFEEMRSLQVLKIIVEKSLWPIKWDSLLTGIPVEFCDAIKLSSELWDEVYLHENEVSIRSLTKLEELGIMECLKMNEYSRGSSSEEHLITDVAFHFSLLKMKDLKHLTVTPGFAPSLSMRTKWYEEKGHDIKVKCIGRMDTEYEQH